MKTRLLFSLVGVAIGFVLPIFAQQKDAVDPELMKAALHSCEVFDDAFNNNDPEVLANLFTEDATLVTDSGVLHGRDDILKYHRGVFKVVHFSNHKNVPTSAYPIGADGKQFWATGSWNHTVQVQAGKPVEQKEFWSAIILNDGTGKHVMQTWNITPAPAVTPSPTASPSTQ
jgi:ketosteroid isomerase-like protein